MDAELKEILKRIEERIENNYNNLHGGIEQISRRLEKLEGSVNDDHDKLIKVEMRIEESIKDLEQHKETEAIYGRQFDSRLKDVESKVWKIILWGAGIGASAGIGGKSLIDFLTGG